MAKVGQNAIGLVETRGLIAAIEAADAMVKTSSVTILGLENTVAALMTIKISGDTAAVRSAVDAGVEAAARVGEVIASHVIPRPASSVSSILLSGQGRDSPASRAGASARSGSNKPLDSMTVRELRALARRASGLSIQGREIARASKKQLLDVLSKRER